MIIRIHCTLLTSVPENTLTPPSISALDDGFLYRGSVHVIELLS